MKKQKLIVLIFTMIMLFALAVPNFALDDKLVTGERVIDVAGFFSGDELNTLRENANKIADEYGLDLLFCIFDSDETEGDIYDEEFVYDYLVENKFMSESTDVEENLVVFFLDVSTYDYNWYTLGSGNVVFTEKDDDDIMEQVAEFFGKDQNFDAFYLIQDRVYTNCEIELSVQNSTSESDSSSSNVATGELSGFEAAKANKTIPNERYAPRLVDTADVLTDEQEAEILERLDEISERTNCDVVVALVNDLGLDTTGSPYSEITPFADDYFDYNGFGLGDTRDGILFTLSVERRKWAISTSGFGIDAFADDGQSYIMDRVVLDLKYDNYYEGVKVFVKYADKFITSARDGKILTGRELKKIGKTWTSPLWWAIPIGFIIAALIMIYHIITAKTVERQNLANEYTVPGSLNITRSTDRFLYRNVTRTVIESSDSGGSGSSTHTSSSGSSHGGSSGDF